VCFAKQTQDADRCNKAARGQPMENSEQKEQESPTNSTERYLTTHPLTTISKRNRRFVRIINKQK